MYRLFSCLLTCVLASCASVPAQPVQSGPTGWVAGSITYESGPGLYVWVVRSKTTGEKFEFALGCERLPCWKTGEEPRLTDGAVPAQRGGGFVVAMPEGRYTVSAWRVARGQYHSRADLPPGIEFTVLQGKASYIGNLHFDAHWDNITLRDRSGRDWPLLKDMQPALRSAELAFTMAPDVSLSRLGGRFEQVRDYSTTTIYVPASTR